MKAKHIFRLDDICENMDWENYFRVRSIFFKNGVKPIIGVIPDNCDREFLKYPKCNFNFWDEIYDLQNNKGWSVALHGYKHLYESKDSGILKINSYSEFAGLSKKRQNEKIKKGIDIFEENKIRIDAFMAPAHSFDSTTIECLRDNGIKVITDGYSFYPYYKDDILYVPQLFARPRNMPFGIYTWCLHTNSMSSENIDKLEVFIKKNKENIISFPEAKNYTIGNINARLQNFVLKRLLILARWIRKV